MTEWPFDALFYVYLCIAKRIKAAIKRVKSRMKFELFRAEAGSFLAAMQNLFINVELKK